MLDWLVLLLSPTCLGRCLEAPSSSDGHRFHQNHPRHLSHPSGRSRCSTSHFEPEAFASTSCLSWSLSRLHFDPFVCCWIQLWDPRSNFQSSCLQLLRYYRGRPEDCLLLQLLTKLYRQWRARIGAVYLVYLDLHQLYSSRSLRTRHPLAIASLIWGHSPSSGLAAWFQAHRRDLQNSRLGDCASLALVAHHE